MQKRRKNRFHEILDRRLKEEGLDKKIALSVYKYMFWFMKSKMHEMIGTYNFKEEYIMISFPGLFKIENKKRDNKKKIFMRNYYKTKIKPNQQKNE